MAFLLGLFFGENNGHHKFGPIILNPPLPPILF
jgi:hypothetical protein